MCLFLCVCETQRERVHVCECKCVFTLSACVKIKGTQISVLIFFSLFTAFCDGPDGPRMNRIFSGFASLFDKGSLRLNTHVTL